MTAQRCDGPKTEAGDYLLSFGFKCIYPFLNGYTYKIIYYLVIINFLIDNMLDTKEQPKTCLSCGKPIKGRSDKKFCDDYCRNNYNNQLKVNDGEAVRLINNALARNRRILQSFLPADKETAKTNRDQLLLKGFSFTYHTHIYTTKTGNTYHYCYDYAYRLLENEWYLIVRKKEE